MEVTKIFTFDSSHRLLNPMWGDEHNREVFGKCFNFPSHGHAWCLHVTIEGSVNRDTGMVLNFVELKRIVTEKIIDVFDHHFINDIVDFIPTCENMLPYICEQLQPILPGLKKLVLYETPTSYASMNCK